ncbi:metallophosphoesterase [uncultured Erythrobacter sp.]|uniref:metallophosphoesterase family protein n=1 Tax=uncultured Erythrobacter sp. TaxID=263913 RepID=UPI002617AB59|nr:metallophosphoesterase [uncultured Erythrobacter sp.]
MTTRLFHISDVHFGVEDRCALEAVEQAVRDEKPDALICTGDLTQRAKDSEYAAAANWFGGLGVPVVLEPGNHDMPYYNLIERFTDPYRRYRKLEAAVGCTLETEHVVLVSLKTTVRAQKRFPWSDGVVTRQALDHTLARLEQLKEDGRSIIVTGHHPLLGSDDALSNPTKGGDRAFAAIAKAGANAILSGHIHKPLDEVRERDGHSMRMIGAGTLSTRLRHGAPPSYRVISCFADRTISSELRLLHAEPR